MNVNGDEPILIYTVDTIVRDDNTLTVFDGGKRLFGRGRLTWLLGNPSIHVTQSTHLETWGRLLDSNILEEARFMTWCIRCHSFKEISAGREAFLEPPGVSGLRNCASTHLKKAMFHIRQVGGIYENG